MFRRLIAAVARIGGAILFVVLLTDCALRSGAWRWWSAIRPTNRCRKPPNPSRDAASIAKMFRRRLRHRRDALLNVGNLEFMRAIRKFEVTADQAIRN